jgi:hypothetical protein
MAENRARWIPVKSNEDAVGLTARERDSLSPYQSPHLSNRIKKEWPKEMSAPEFEDLKNFFEYIITKQNKAFREEMKQDIKALQDNMVKNNAKLQENLRTESERLHRELLECLHSETKKKYWLNKPSKESNRRRNN